MWSKCCSYEIIACHSRISCLNRTRHIHFSQIRLAFHLHFYLIHEQQDYLIVWLEKVRSSWTMITIRNHQLTDCVDKNQIEEESDDDFELVTTEKCFGSKKIWSLCQWWQTSWRRRWSGSRKSWFEVRRISEKSWDWVLKVEDSGCCMTVFRVMKYEYVCRILICSDIFDIIVRDRSRTYHEISWCTTILYALLLFL